MSFPPIDPNRTLPLGDTLPLQDVPKVASNVKALFVKAGLDIDPAKLSTVLHTLPVNHPISGHWRWHYPKVANFAEEPRLLIDALKWCEAKKLINETQRNSADLQARKLDWVPGGPHPYTIKLDTARLDMPPKGKAAKKEEVPPASPAKNLKIKRTSSGKSAESAEKKRKYERTNPGVINSKIHPEWHPDLPNGGVGEALERETAEVRTYPAKALAKAKWVVYNEYIYKIMPAKDENGQIIPGKAANAPPANVILSDRNTQLVMQAVKDGIIPITDLVEKWPGTFTRAGSPHIARYVIHCLTAHPTFR